ncbi:MAG: 30S ribosomal protein S17 [Acidobacteria bacterium]|nr:30S ribosomal protein S17 [Acidobacteriota bacterium]
MENQRGQRVKRIGTVVSNKMDKTIVVQVERRMAHALYQRTMKKSKKFVAHDERNEANIGDRVEIIESRPYSKRKRWRLVRVVEQAQA